MSPQRIISLLFLCGLGLVSGCSAIASRSLVALGPSPKPPLYFGGVRTDYQIFHAESTKDNWFWQGYSFIDAPFSFGGDIVFLPYDLYTSCRWSNRPQSEETAQSSKNSAPE